MDNTPAIAQPLIGEHMTQREYQQAIIDQLERAAAAHKAYVRQTQLEHDREMQAIRMQAQCAYLQIQADMWRSLGSAIKGTAISRAQPIKGIQPTRPKFWPLAAIQFPLWWMLFYWLLTR